MNTKYFAPILSTIILLFLSTAIFAVPPTEEVIQQLKDEGRFDQFVQNMQAANAKGVDQGIADDGKGVSRLALSGAQTYRVLVILVDFPNKPYTSGFVAGTQTMFDSLLFSDGINPTGSMKEFYYENSYGNFILQGDVVGWYTASQTSDYYTNFCDGSDGLGSYPHNAQKLVEEAVDLADADVDYSLYDNDHNGYVDGIFVVHAGTGYEETGNDCEIHSHQWSINPRYRDGVYVSSYSIEPEESPSNQGLIPIGVFCHEFGHVLGLPDLYDTDYSSAGAGKWALMASGSYNGQSRSPSHFIVWSKMKLGWLTPVTPASNQTGVNFPAIEWNPVGYRLWTNGQVGSQYFMVENRQKMGSDAYLPGSGILVWHIDETVGGNTNDWHPKVMLEQADGKFDLQYDNNTGDAGDAYPDGGYHPSFTDKTTPNSKAYNSSSSQVAVWDVSPTDSIMTADLDVVWSRPYLYFTNYSFSDAVGGNGDGILDAGETIQLTFTVANDWKTATSADAELTVDDGTLTITNGFVSLGTINSGGSVSNSGSPLEFEIPSDYTARIDSFFVEISSDGGTFVSVLPIEQNVGKPQLLIVDDDNNDNVDTYYTSSLYKKRLPYDLWNESTQGTPSLATLNNYDAAIWFTGDYRASPLTAADITAMEGYLDGGHSLFLSGQGIAAQLTSFDPTFLANYLRASYLSNSLVPVLAVDGASQVFTGLGNIVITGASGASNQTKPDHISAVNSGNPELDYYGTTDLAAVSYSGAYKLMFFSFGFEAIVAGDSRFVERDTVYYRTLDFLGVSSSAGYPEIAYLEVGPGDQMHLLDHTPTITWPYFDAGGAPQQQYEVQVGTDNDWSIAELWDTGPVSSSDTSVVYSGTALVDGQTCYVRVRAYNGTQWSNWQTDIFRLDSAPTVPTNLTPDNLAGVTSATPVLAHLNSTDNESDPLTYGYEVYEDSELSILVAQADGQPQGSGSSSWTVNTSLTDDMVYYWRTRAYDGYEYGSWSPAASFWVNSNNSAPAAFSLLSPPDSQLVSDPVPPTFTWAASSDTDLYDTVSYTFILGADTTAGLTDTVYTPTDSLTMGQEYLWKVLAVDKFGGVTPSSAEYLLSTLLPGDANTDGTVNVGDVVFLVNYVFRQGPPPDPLKAGDANGDCNVDVGDAVYLINFIFREGAEPQPGCA